MPRPILIAGPTASGKSALALALAQRLGGVVVNADSMQVYRELPVLTAQPMPAEQSMAPHRLFGHVPAANAFSVGRWLEEMRGVLAEAAQEDWRPILVGGTGLYLKALLEGLSPVPPIPAPIREHWRQAAASRPAVDLHAELARRDPATAARLMPNDAQRIVRALEVLAATGRPLSDWQQEPGQPLLAASSVVRVRLEPPRAWLRARCDSRFDAMLEAGAIEEVRDLVGQGLSPDLPVMRALGVAPLAEYLAGRLDRAAASQRAKLETGRYVKRQQTWLRKFMADWPCFDPAVASTADLANAILADLGP